MSYSKMRQLVDEKVKHELQSNRMEEEKRMANKSLEYMKKYGESVGEPLDLGEEKKEELQEKIKRIKTPGNIIVKDNGEMKSIEIHGKEYIPVSERVKYFNKNYHAGAIVTELLKNDEQVVFKATVWKDVSDKERCFVGHSQAVKGQGLVNETAAMENAETSAVGRALGFAGIGVIESIASSDEITKASQPVRQLDGTVTTPSYREMWQSTPTNISEQKYVCDLCGADAKWSDKKQKYYCPNTKQHLADKQRWNITTKSNKEFEDSLPEENPIMEM